ncbi:hypothetical protein IF2G_00046 [Cordyceps javanica]|nr:hypothetical protein IF2G_00046 [Cordyceps javanica]
MLPACDDTEAASYNPTQSGETKRSVTFSIAHLYSAATTEEHTSSLIPPGRLINNATVAPHQSFLRGGGAPTAAAANNKKTGSRTAKQLIQSSSASPVPSLKGRLVSAEYLVGHRDPSRGEIRLKRNWSLYLAGALSVDEFASFDPSQQAFTTMLRWEPQAAPPVRTHLL